MVKTCSKCKVEKSIDQFNKRPTRKSGLQSQCKICQSIRNKINKQNYRKIGFIEFQTKLCTSCGGEFDMEGFSKNSSTPTGFHYQCKNCMNRKRSEKNVALKFRLKQFNITIDEFERLCKLQNNLCAICGEPEIELDVSGKVRRLSVDHDHKCCPGSFSCGKCIRGLTCSGCNQFIGRAKESIQTLQNAINYLISPPLVGIVRTINFISV